jgi:hypothetical protein
MTAPWLCSRNDLFANGGGVLAAGGGCPLVSRWPNFVVGSIIATLFLRSALTVLSQAIAALQTSPTNAPTPAQQPRR